MSRLFDSLARGFVPGTLPVVAEAIQAIEGLPGLADMEMDGQWYRVMEVLTWAVPALQVRGMSSFDPLLARIARAVCRTGKPAPADLAELQVAGFLAAKARASPRYVLPDSHASADLRVTWPSSVEIDVEVTRPEPKKEMLLFQAAAARLSARLNSLGRDVDLLVHLGELPTAGMEDAIVTLASNLSAGDEAGSDGAWSVKGSDVPEGGDPYVINDGSQDAHPGWWEPRPPGGTGFSTSGKLNGPNATRRQPQARVVFPVPIVRYVNPILGKLERGQHVPDLPFVVAIDVTNLSGADANYRADLPGYFQAWPTLSAILSFQVASSVDALLWMWQLFLNPNAAMPLSVEVTDALPPGQAWRTRLPIATEEME